MKNSITGKDLLTMLNFCQQNLKEIRKTEEKCSKYAGSVKFNGILREQNPAIPIKSYKDKFC